MARFEPGPRRPLLDSCLCNCSAQLKSPSKRHENFPNIRPKTGSDAFGSLPIKFSRSNQSKAIHRCMTNQIGSHSHGENTGSSPVGVTKVFKDLGGIGIKPPNIRPIHVRRRSRIPTNSHG